MNDVALIAIAAAALLFVMTASALIYLWRAQQKLKQDVQALTKKLQGSIDDVAGLCSAAVSVDQRLAINESRLEGMLENINMPPTPAEYEEVPEQPQPRGYELAIEKIRRGADVDDLVKSCGLTHDEAVLLIRLHGR
ncbi:DUF2802 domain-containing protein [Methylomonas sp. MgM2]